MSGRTGCFFLRASQVMMLGLCGACAWNLSVAQTPYTPNNGTTPILAAANGSSTPGTNGSATGDDRGAAGSHHMVPDSTPRLAAGDLVEINVFGVPDLSTRIRISGTGDVYMPLINYVHIGELTTDEAQELIQKRLEDGGFVRSPHVSIFIADAQSQAVTMVGELAHPGPYTIQGNRTLYDMISAAGGLSDKAGREVTIFHRDDPDKKIRVQLTQNLAEDTESNVDILPGDTIIVSKAGVIYVVGDVQHPSGFLIDDSDLTVLKALALAGGNNHTAALNKTKILRRTPGGIQEIPVPLKKILYAKAPDLSLMKGDVLFIPGSAAKAAAYRTADAVVSASAALGVVAAHP